MKPWVQESMLWIGAAFLLSISLYLFLLLGSCLPRISPVSFAAACERAIPQLPIQVFATVCTVGTMFVFLREGGRQYFSKK
jgi:hypothetical protein